MMNILNRWQQLSRRYFWPPVLLGIIAASIGLPSVVNGHEVDELSQNCSHSSRFIPFSIQELAALHAGYYRKKTVYRYDHWQRHNLNCALRQISWRLSPKLIGIGQITSRQTHYLILLDSLRTTMVQAKVRPIRQVSDSFFSLSPFSFEAPYTGLWVAQIQGIRAGPLTV